MRGETEAAAWSAAGFGAYETTMLAMLVAGELSVRQIVRRRGEPVSRVTIRRAVGTIAALPLTHLLYALALVNVLWARQVRWRGVTYRVDGASQVEVIGDARPGEQRAAGEAQQPD